MYTTIFSYGANLLVCHLPLIKSYLIRSCKRLVLPCQNSIAVGFKIYPPQCAGSVSYTHLDVYKRQVRVYNKGLGFTLYNLNKSLPYTGQGAAPLPTNGATTMAQNASSASSGYGIRSIFGTLGYSFADRFSANVNIRRDGTSRIINPDNRAVSYTHLDVYKRQYWYS